MKMFAGMSSCVYKPTSEDDVSAILHANALLAVNVLAKFSECAAQNLRYQLTRLVSRS